MYCVLECSSVLTELRQEQQNLSHKTVLDKSFDPTKDIQTDTDNETQDYKKRKEFWEQLSTSSSSIEKEVPTPKPRSSITSIKSISTEQDPSVDVSSLKTLVTSPEVHTKEIVPTEISTSAPTTTAHVVQETTRKLFSRENTRGESLDSEMEYISKHPDSLAFENSCFTYEDEDETIMQSARMYDKRYSECLNEIPPVPCPRKTILERSTSLPCADIETKESQVKQKKKFFEAQIRKEIAVEQLEEEGSPERKSISLDQSLSSPDQEAILNRQIHSHIFTNEMDEQIDSLVPEEKIIQENADIRRLTEFFESRSIESKESLEKTDSQESTDEPQRSKIAEVMLYKSESISKPSDSLEVQIDRSDVDSTMKEEDLDEDLKEIENELHQNITEQTKRRDEGNYTTSIDETKLTRDNIALVSLVKGQDDGYNGRDIRLEDRTSPELCHLRSDIIEDPRSTIHTPEEHIPDTIWEVGVQDGPEIAPGDIMSPFSIGKEVIIDNEEEYAEEFSFTKPVTIEKENIILEPDSSNLIDSSFIREGETDDITYSDTIESQITDQLDLCNLSKEEARNIAESVVEEIEEELAKRKDVMAHIEDQVLNSTLPVSNISDSYLKEFAEKENMDIKLIESVLAKKQRDQFKKLSRNDTATSSIEITDEDLRSSGLETELTGESLAYRMSGIIESDDEEDEEKDLPEMDKYLNDDFSGSQKSKEYFKETTETKFEATEKPTETKEFDYKRKEEEVINDRITQETYEASMNEKSFGHSDTLEKTKETCRVLEKDDNVFRKDTVNIDSLKNDFDESDITVSEKSETSDGDVSITDHKKGSSVLSKLEREEKSETKTEERNDTQEYTEIKTQNDLSNDWQSEVKESFEFSSNYVKENDTETLSKVDTKSKKDIKEEGEKSYKTQSERILDTGTSKIISSSNIEKTHIEKSHKTEILDHSRTECKIEIRKEYLGDASMIEELEKAGFRISEDIREETSRLVKNETINKEKSIQSKVEYVVKDKKDLVETVDTNDTDDTKSSSTEATVIEQQSTNSVVPRTSVPDCSTVKEDSLKSPTLGDNFKIDDYLNQGVTLRKHESSQKADRKSGGDYDQHSSSEGSHYLSSEQISEKSSKPSRPCSTDVDALLGTGGAGSSEYESAISHVSGRTSQTTNEYQTAASSLSSRESMRSLDSESSGNLASVSETLIPSASDLDQDMDIDSIPEDKCSYQQILEPHETDTSSHVVRGGFPHIPHSSSQPLKTEVHMKPTLTKSHTDGTLEQPSCQMKRSPEIALVADNSPISESLDEKCLSSLDDGMSMSTSDATGIRTIIELSKTESERMEGSGTSDQHSLTVSATSGELSLSSESRDENITNDKNVHTSGDATMRSLDDVNSITILSSSAMENGGSIVSTQIISSSEQTSQIDREPSVDSDTKKKHGHRRNESKSFNSMIPVFTGGKKASSEDVAESDKYVIKDKEIDETDSEADQGLYRDIQEAHILNRALFEEEKTRSALPSYSSDDYNEEILSELISSESHITVNEPIARPKTPEPPDDLPGNLKAAFYTKGDISTEGFVCDVVPSVIERHHSSASDHEDELAEAEAAFHMVPHVSPVIPTHLPPTIPEDPFEENKELETREALLKEATMRKLAQADMSPAFIPDITVTEHLTPLVDKDFKYPDLDLEAEMAKKIATPDTPASVSSVVSSEASTDQGQDYFPNESNRDSHTSTVPQNIASSTVGKENVDFKSSDGDSPTSDSFEILEKPDEMDDFVIVEEVAKEAEEKDDEGKSVQISKRRSVRKYDEENIISPPKQPKTKMIKVEYYGETSGQSDEIGPFHLEGSPEKTSDGKVSSNDEDTSLECSPPTDDENVYDKEAEARRKWIEMQFQGDPTVAAAYGYEMEFERGPLEDIKEEELTELESSSKFGSVSSQVSQSIGSIGSFGKISLSSTPDFDVLAGKKFFMRSGSEQDNVSMSSLQEFERLEQLMALESMKARSSGSQGSQDSMNSSGRSTSSAKKSSNSGGDITSNSLKEFEGLERACIEAEKIEHKARAEELMLIEEGHESLTSESSSCVTITGPAKVEVDSDSENYEQRMFAIDEIIREAESNVEQFADIKTESIGRGDSLEEVARIPDLEFDHPSVKKDEKRKESEDDMVTSTDSLELKTAISRKELTTSTDSLEMKTNTGDPMSASTDSIEYHLKQKRDSKNNEFMKDSIEGTLPSLESQDKLKYSDYIEDQVHDQSSSSGRDGDLSSSGKEDASGEINRMPPPRSEQHLGSTDSIDPTSSTATHATYQYETDSLMSSSFTSGGSNTLMSSMETLDNVTRTGVWFEDGRPYVTEVIEPVSDEEFSHTIHRTVELPPEVHKVTFSGPNAEEALKEYVERFGPGEDVSETKEIDSDGNVHIKRVVQRRVVVKPEEISSSEGPISSLELEEYLKKLGQEQRQEQDQFEFEKDITDSNFDHVITSIRESSPSYPTKSPTASSHGLITGREKLFCVNIFL